MGFLSLTMLELGHSQPGEVPWRWVWGGGTALCSCLQHAHKDAH